MHSHYSDGRASPQELLEQARHEQLKVIAITDHETTLGNREAQELAPSFGIEVIPAMEITCYWEDYTGHGGGPDIDLLAYFIDLESPLLAATEDRLLSAIKERIQTACHSLEPMGLNLSLDDVLEVHPVYPGFLALYTALLQKSELPAERALALTEQLYFSSGRSALSIAEGISLIHQLGGVAVLAHPSIIHRQSDGEPLSERGMMELVEAGLDGVEVFHYRLRERQRQHFSMLARMFRLLVTGGSDEHGGPGNYKRFATESISTQMVEALRSRART